ncbi:MAG: response regulator transcription factor [Crocinitomicaceae bacterium]|nr:LuxR C-terminal-related transcriptional regulator [Flavobacteriales bacterium]NQZ36048.1 response regulator transcription factor [Crocinitomicaceae bacterium]
MRIIFILTTVLVCLPFSGKTQLSVEELLVQINSTSNLTEQLILLDSISAHYKRVNETQKALIYSRKSSALKDSIYQLNFRKSSNEIEEKLGLIKAQKEIIESNNEIKLLTNERKNLLEEIWVYRYLSIAVLMLLIFIGYRIIRNYRLNKEISLQKEATLKKYKTLEEAYTNVYNVLETLKAKTALENQKDKSELPDWVVQLSKKEIEVLAYLSVGMTDKEISEKMRISLSTVRTYCRRLYSKLLVKNRSEAASFAVKYKLI